MRRLDLPPRLVELDLQDIEVFLDDARVDELLDVAVGVEHRAAPGEILDFMLQLHGVRDAPFLQLFEQRVGLLGALFDQLEAVTTLSLDRRGQDAGDRRRQGSIGGPAVLLIFVEIHGLSTLAVRANAGFVQQGQ